MDPIKTYFLKKLSSNPGFFAEVGKDSVMVDIKKETGLTVQDEQTLDLLYDEYGVDLTQKKKSTPNGESESEEFLSESDTQDREVPEGAYESDYGDIDFKPWKPSEERLKQVREGQGLISEHTTEKYKAAEAEGMYDDSEFMSAAEHTPEEIFEAELEKKVEPWDIEAPELTREQFKEKFPLVKTPKEIEASKIKKQIDEARQLEKDTPAIVRVKRLVESVREQRNKLQMNSMLGQINKEFLERNESEVKVDLEKMLLGHGFTINEAEAGSNAIEVVSANGQVLNLELGMSAVSKLGSRWTEFVAGSGDFDSSAKENLYWMKQADDLKSFIEDNSISSAYVYYDLFEENPAKAVDMIYNDMMKPGYVFYEDEQTRIDISDQDGIVSELRSVNRQISDATETMNSRTQKDLARLEDRKKIKKLEEKREKLAKYKRINTANRRKYSMTIADLMQQHGGVENLFDLTGDKGKMFASEISKMGIDPGDLILKTLKIEGKPVSFNEFRNLITDYVTRDSVLEGDISIEISNSEELGLMNDFIDEAIALDKRSKAGWLKTSVNTLNASIIETIADTRRATMDVAGVVSKNLYLLFSNDSEETKQATVDALDEYISESHRMAIDVAKEFRLKTPEISGEMSDSENIFEMMHKGSKSAFESLPTSALFMMAPEVGLAMTGTSSYGRNMRELENIRSFIKETGDPEGLYDNIDLTVGRARALAASKALGETMLTGMFTYSFLKGMSKSANALNGMTRSEAAKHISFYSSSLFGKTSNVFGKSLLNELKEENIIAGTNMWLDEVYGLREYSFSDYMKTMGNVSLSVPFMSIPMSGVGYSKMDRASRETVHHLIARAQWDTNMYSNIEQFRKLDEEINNAEQKGEKLEQAVYDERAELGEGIIKENQRLADNLNNNATSEQVVQIAKNQNQIASHAKQLSRSDIGDSSKKIYEEKISELIQKNNEIFSQLDVDEFSKSASEMASKKIEEARENLSEEEQIELDNYLNPKDQQEPPTKKEEAARSLGAVVLVNYKNDPRHKELSDFLYGLRDSDINDFTFKVLTESKKSIEEGRPLDRVYNTVIRANDIVSQIVSENPSTERITPMTASENLFTGKKIFDKGTRIVDYNIATVNHAITMLLKNDRMATPLRNLSGGIDAKLVTIQNQNRKKLISFLDMEFLGEKISKKRKEAFHSEESDVERMFLSEILKVEEGVSADKTFQAKKKMMLENLAKLKNLDKSSYGVKRAKLWEDTYNRLLASSESISEAVSNASSDNLAAVNHLQSLFVPIKDNVFSHMENYYGRVPTRYMNYLPSFYDLQQDGDVKTTNDFGESIYGPSAMMETLSIDELANTNRIMIADSWTKMVFRSMENAESEYTIRPDLDALKGVIESKAFSDLFNQESISITGLSGTGNDFQKLTGIIDQKINKINSIIQSNGSPQKIDNGLGKDVFNLFTKGVSARRLSTLSMRASQGYSALFSVVPLLSSKSSRMMFNNVIKFTGGGLTSDLNSNEGFQSVFNKSATAGRGGLESLPTGYAEQFYKRISANPMRRKADEVIEAGNKVADKVMEKTLAESDKTAGMASFGALYYERMLQKNPSKIKDMSFDQFWAWSKDPANVDSDAIAWADSQIDRSQMQAMPWNQGQMFNKRSVANLLFPFGRFAYNRKAGMANDWSIINDTQTATQADKAKALRRLASATIEIGVFKAIQPMFSIALTQTMIPLMAGLVGWDDEYDEIVQMAKKGFSALDPQRISQQVRPYAISNYERDAAKEFKTAMFEGMIPIPTPSVANEIIMAGVNTMSKKTGMSDEDVFNIYSKDVRDMFSQDESGAISKNEVGSFLLSNSGFWGMAAEDVMKTWGAVNALKGRMPSLYGSKDPYIMKQAMPAANVLFYGRMINSVLPIADLNRFNNKLESLIQRRYTTTVPQNYDEK
jgi:hypothetical protein